MSGPVTLADVQSLVATQEDNQRTRHTEVLERISATDRKASRIEERLRQLEIHEAENRPLISGGKAIVAMMFAAVMAGYIGSYIPS